MSEATQVPMICDDCGGTLTDADLFSMALGEKYAVYWHFDQSQCITSLNERLTAATQRAEAAEARRDQWERRARQVVQERRALRDQAIELRDTRDALRKVNDEMVERFLHAYAKCENERPQTFTHRIGIRAALTVALAVQPITGAAHE